MNFIKYFIAGIIILSTGNLSAQFRASVVKVNITPSTPKQLLGYAPRLSTGVHDSIYHRIVALDDGSTQFFLVSTEICEMSPTVYDHVAEMLQKKLGIDRKNFWWTVTHTHSAPEVGDPGIWEKLMGERFEHAMDTSYTSFIEQTLINGITEARKNLVPARLGVGWGFSQANINRRAIDVDGKAALGLNPDGPTDRRIGIIRLEKKDGTPMALIANYPIHGTVLGPQPEISGDVQGVVSEYVQQKTGVPLVFINGAAGNLAPIYSVYESPEAGHLSQFRVLLGDKILEANKKILATTDSVKLFSSELTVETPRKANMGWPDYMKKYSSTTTNGINLIKVPIRFLRINNDIAIWSTPLELFCEISNYIRDESPFPFTFYYGYANGSLGYLAAEDQWKYGGYEVDIASPFTPALAGTLTEAVVSYLQGEMITGGMTSAKKASKKR